MSINPWPQKQVHMEDVYKRQEEKVFGKIGYLKKVKRTNPNKMCIRDRNQVGKQH